MHFTPPPDYASVSLQNLRLRRHPACAGPSTLEVKASLLALPTDEHPGLDLQFDLFGAVDTLCMPSWVGTGRADGLWQHTCAELFVRRVGDPAYQEFNFSPSGQWAAYRFSSERVRDPLAESQHPALPPTIQTLTTAESIRITIRLPLSCLPATGQGGALRLGLSLVAEHHDGALSYWALHHPRADRPDFHHPEGCVLPLQQSHSTTPSNEKLP